MHPQAGLVRVGRGASVPGQFLLARGTGGGVRIGSGVQLDGLRPDAMGRVDLRQVGVDEGADLDFRAMKLGDEALEPVHVGHHVEPAFGGDFLTAFRHETDFLRLDEKRLVVIATVAAISRFSGIRRARDNSLTSASWIWRRSSRRWTVMASTPACSASRAAARTFGSGGETCFPVAVTGLAQRGHMIDVQSKFGHGS